MKFINWERKGNFKILFEVQYSCLDTTHIVKIYMTDPAFQNYNVFDWIYTRSSIDDTSYGLLIPDNKRKR